MKIIYRLLFSSTLVLSALIGAFGQNNTVGIGTSAPNRNAVLDLVSPTHNQGLLVPRLTTVQRNAPALVGALSPAENGLLVFDSDNKAFYYWQDTQWVAVGGSSSLVAGPGISLLGGVISATDESPGNEIQDLQLSGTNLSVTNNPSATSIDLSTLVGADAQQLTLTGTDLSIDNGNTVDLSGLLDNTDNQDLNLAADLLTVTGGATAVDLSPYLDNTDAQELGLAGNNLSISGGTVTVDLSPYLDNTDAQQLDLASNTLSISGGAGTIDLSPYLDNTDEQDLNLSGNTLSISGGATPIDLSGYLDNTDAQELDLTGNALSISGATATVDLSSYLDNTDNQELNLAGDQLSISGGAVSVDLSTYKDNTDNQDLSLVGTTLSLTGDATSVSLPTLISSTGTQNALAKWNNVAGTTIGNSSISDDGSTVSVNNSNLSVTINNGAVTPMLQLNQANTGDASMSFRRSAQYYSLGVDMNDGDKFKISASSNLGTNDSFTIQPDGKIGIGTTSPVRPLHLFGSNAIPDGANGLFMDFQNSAAVNGTMTGLRFKLQNTLVDESYKGAIFFRRNCATCEGLGDLIFAVNDVNSNINVTTADTRMTIGATGVTVSNALNLQGPLQLNGSAGSSGEVLRSNGTGAAPTWIDPLILISDERLKSGISDLGYGLDNILALRPVSYQLRDSEDKRTHLGLIAQEMKNVLPELVATNKATGYYGVNYIEIVPVLINAVKEQQSLILRQQSDYETLRKQLQGQEQRLKKLEAILGLDDATTIEN